MSSTGRLARLAPPFFVLLWASGFVVARLVRQHAEPESFLAIRLGASAILLGVVSLAASAAWPRTTRGWIDNLIAGVLLQGIYLGGTYWAVRHGLAAALASLICSLQPLVTAALAGPLLGEKVGGLRWLGIAVGFVGVVLVLAPDLAGHAGTGAGAPLLAIAACVVAMLSITVGTIWQKRISASADLLAGVTIQMIAAFAITLPVALMTEHGVDNDASVWIGLAWGVGLSVVATLLLLRMIKEGAVAQVTSLFYLVPAVTALMTFAFFGDALSRVQVLGMGVATLGVFLARARTVAGPSFRGGAAEPGTGARLGSGNANRSRILALRRPG